MSEWYVFINPYLILVENSTISLLLNIVCLFCRISWLPVLYWSKLVCLSSQFPILPLISQSKISNSQWKTLHLLSCVAVQYIWAKHPPWNCDLCLWAQDWGERIFIGKAALLSCFDNKWSTHDLSMDKPWKGY